LIRLKGSRSDSEDSDSNDSEFEDIFEENTNEIEEKLGKFKCDVTENHPFSSVFLKCPECDFDTKEENLMENHITGNHLYF
jgi:hypothetical protein